MPLRKTVEKARKLRRTMTPPEVRLWQYLRTSPAGLKFRRQHPIGSYVTDFYCAAARLVIEVDGEIHSSGIEHDNARDAWLASQGYRVARFTARDVMSDLDMIGRSILDLWTASPLHRPADGPPPHPSAGEE